MLQEHIECPYFKTPNFTIDDPFNHRYCKNYCSGDRLIVRGSGRSVAHRSRRVTARWSGQDTLYPEWPGTAVRRPRPT